MKKTLSTWTASMKNKLDALRQNERLAKLRRLLNVYYRNPDGKLNKVKVSASVVAACIVLCLCGLPFSSDTSDEWKNEDGFTYTPGYTVSISTGSNTSEFSNSDAPETKKLIAETKATLQALEAVRSVHQASGLNEQMLLESASMGETRMLDSIISMKEFTGVNLNACNEQLNTALHIAATKGYSEYVKMLVDAGVSLDLKNNKSYTPLQLAASQKHLGCVKALLDGGARIDVTTDDGLIALHLSSDPECTRALIKAGTDPNYLSPQNYGAIHMAIAASRADIVKVLIECGADVNLKGPKGYTPLQLAVGYNENQCAELLKNAGAHF